MKKVFFALFGLIIVSCSVAVAQQESWGRRGNEPGDVFDNVAHETNDGLQIQETAINDVSRRQGNYSYKNRITNTLVSVKNNITPYLDWLVYLGLTLAVILIIYNGFRLMVGGLTKTEHSTVIKNITNIAIGVAILMGFWAIIKGVMIVINTIAGQ